MLLMMFLMLLMMLLMRMVMLIIMFCVLLILDSINKVANTGWFQGVTDQIRRKGEVVSDILDFLIQYKIECVKRAEPTPIMDR